jgi:hypothetical protein
MGGEGSEVIKSAKIYYPCLTKGYSSQYFATGSIRADYLPEN